MARTSTRRQRLPLHLGDTPEQARPILEAIVSDWHEPVNWHGLADCLEDAGQDLRARLVRASMRYWGLVEADFEEANEELQGLLAAGVRPCVPEVTNDLAMRFAFVPAGKFMMGSHGHSDELHRCEVELTRAFWAGVHPVTQKQFGDVMGWGTLLAGFQPEDLQGDPHRSPRWDVSEHCPVWNVDYHNAAEFCETLTELYPLCVVGKKPRRAGKKQGVVARHRLPTEAEWEYACRARACQHQSYHFGETLASTQANFWENFDGNLLGAGMDWPTRPSPVGSYPPNALGLYDLHGNVDEWCGDWHAEGGYGREPQRDPTGPTSGVSKVCRGGSHVSRVQWCRSAARSSSFPSECSPAIGFRVVLQLP